MRAQLNGSNGDLTLRCWAEPNHDFPAPTVEGGVDEAAAAAGVAKAFLEGRCGVEVTVSGQQHHTPTYEEKAVDPYSPFVLVKVVIPPPPMEEGGEEASSAEMLQVSYPGHA